MRRIFLLLFIVLIGVPFSVSVASASKRVALVIGNAAYKNVPVLANPYNDATDMATKLKSLGFSVVEGLDTDLLGLRRKIGDFVDQLDKADLAMFYYAGHGLQVNGKNYLVPVDAVMESSLDLEFEAVPVDLILSAMEARVDTNILFLDACRDNPLARSLSGSLGRSASVGRGLAELGAGRGTLISFATQPGNIALDGTDRNSPFTAALVKHLGTPGDSLSDAMIKVRNEVIRSTKGRQVPWEHSSLTGRVVLNASTGPSSAPAAKPDPQPRPAVGLSNSNLQVEMAFWDAVKNADSAIYFETYLRRYPNGLFSDIAKLKIESLQQRNPAPVAAAQPDPVVAPEPEAGAAAAEEEKTTEVAVLKPEDLARQILGKSDANEALTNREEIRDLQQRLYDLNFEPGTPDGVAGRKTRDAVKAFQASLDIEQTGQVTRGMLNLLQETEVPEDWGAMGFRISGKRIFDSNGLSSRRDAEQEINRLCRNCSATTVFSGKECASIALSSRGWGWAVRKSRDEVKTAALNACSVYGGGCQIQKTICADGR